MGGTRIKGTRLRGSRAAAAALTAAVVLQGGFAAADGRAFAQETEAVDLLELTAPKLQTEEGGASSARLGIGDWLDYGDYDLERADIPGTDYLFYITTQTADGTVINDDQLAYCVQSYFLTPLPGDHSADMTDQVSAIGGETNLQKVIYYGYGGAGYEKEEFLEFLEGADGTYFETVYEQLEENEQEELCYILTHGAASYAYFLDGTPLEEYLELQFEMKYGDGWEKELDSFKRTELEKAGINDGDLNLFGATYGMNTRGIAMTKGWYEILTGKETPCLEVSEAEAVYTLQGNERNPELTFTFTVPAGFSCTVYREEGEPKSAAEGEAVAVRPAERFAFTYTGETVSLEQDGIAELTVPVEGVLLGTENEVWNLVLLQTSKGTAESVSKRQQDIAAVSRVDAGRTGLGFEIGLQKGSASIRLTDEEGQAVQGARFGVYYDEECGRPVTQDGQEVRLTTDSLGEAYLEFVMNRELEENGGRLYVKELDAPTGYLPDGTVRAVRADGSAEMTNVRETTAVAGTVAWRAPEGTKLPEEVTATLIRDQEVVDTRTVTEKEGWSYEWPELLKYRQAEDGSAVEYDYRVELAPIAGYDTVIDGYDAVNTITGETSIKGQGVWRDHEDADGLRPESLTVKLYRDGELADSREISEADDWKYCFEGLDRYSGDGSGEYTYTVEAEAPEGYTAELQGEELLVTHTVSTALNIEGFADVAGRNTKEGEFSLELTQVTDETGEAEVENGIHETAVNDETGKVVFPEIVYTEPGTYYYRITETAGDGGEDPEAYIAKVEVTVGGEDKNQLEAAVTYPKGQPEFEHVYTASGQTVIGEVLVEAENGTLAAGTFQVELKDESGTVLQTGTNDASGRVVFEPLAYTEEDIGKEYVYTISEVNGGAENITYDATIYTVTVKVEDSENSDGTLEITQTSASMIFKNIIAEPETETETETEPATETETETEPESETETETETEPESETETETETEPATETETESDTKAASSTETAETGSGTAIWSILLLIIAVLVAVFLIVRRRQK